MTRRLTVEILEDRATPTVSYVEDFTNDRYHFMAGYDSAWDGVQLATSPGGNIGATLIRTVPDDPDGGHSLQLKSAGGAAQYFGWVYRTGQPGSLASWQVVEAVSIRL